MPDLALFDFDGTLTDAESYGPFLRRLISPERLRGGPWRVAPWVVGYRFGLVSGVRVRSRIADVGLREVHVAYRAQRGTCFCDGRSGQAGPSLRSG